MKIQQLWRASSRPKEPGENAELVKLSGQWNIGIQVSITNPYEYSPGPVKVKIREPKEKGS